MISICRICLNNILEGDLNSRRLIDLHSYYKPLNGICKITFLDLVSSCLPGLNLHIPVDGIPRVCGSCCSKIIEIFTLKQQSVEIEKLLVQFVKFHNRYDNSNNQPIKLADVASMYSSIFNTKYTHVVVVDLLKLLYSACSKQDVKDEAAKRKNSTSEESTLDNDEDAVILVVEENSDNNTIDGKTNIRTNAELIDVAYDVNMTTAEAWFRMSQTNLLPKENEKSELQQLPSIKENSKNTVRECKKSTNEKNIINDESAVTSQSQITKHCDNEEDRDSKWHFRSNRTVVRVKSTKVPEFLKEFKSTKQKPSSKAKRFNNGSMKSLNQMVNEEDPPVSKTENKDNQLVETKQNETSSNSVNQISQNGSTSTIISAPEQKTNASLTNTLRMKLEDSNLSSHSNVTYQCKICEIIFLNTSELRVHLCCTTTVQCEVCHILFASVERWNQHNCIPPQNAFKNTRTQMNINTDNNCTGEICDVDFASNLDVMGHVVTSLPVNNAYNNNNNDMVGNILQKSPETLHIVDTSSSRMDLTIPLEKDIEIYFKCDQCPLNFETESQLLLHLEQHANWSRKESYQCDMCERQFQYAHLLRRHKNVHSPRQCFICGQSFALSLNLHVHMLLHNTMVQKTESEVNTEATEPSPIITVPMDTSTDPAEVEISAHSPNSDRSTNSIAPVSSNIDEPTFRCMQCYESFKDKYELECHADDHIIDIKFECDVCHEIYPSRPAYRMHKTVKCRENVLNRKLIIKNVPNDDEDAIPLKLIRKRVGNTVFTKRSAASRLYHCRLCPKKFISQKFLMSHFPSHIKKLPLLHNCKDCGIGFAKINALNKHVTLKHPVERQE